MATTLSDVWSALESSVAKRGIALFRGMPDLISDESGGFRSATWDGELSDFLDVAQAVVVTLAYAEREVFDYRAALLQAVREQRPTFDPAEPAEVQDPTGVEMFKRLQDRTKKFAKRDGEAWTVQCAWIKDGVLHYFTKRAEWSDDFDDLVIDVVSEFERIVVDDRSAESVVDSEHIRTCAEELARHPRFAEANTEAKRFFIAEQLFPEEEMSHWIADHAEMFYWWEIEPTERTSKAAKVRELFDSGITATAIGGMMSVSLAKVRALLAQTETPN